MFSESEMRMVKTQKYKMSLNKGFQPVRHLQSSMLFRGMDNELLCAVKRKHDLMKYYGKSNLTS